MQSHDYTDYEMSFPMKSDQRSMDDEDSVDIGKKVRNDQVLF